MKETIRVIQPGSRRIKIFVDFWNVLINARNQTSRAFDVSVKWDTLADMVVRESRSGHFDETAGSLAGCYIFGSYNKSSSHENKMVKKVQDSFGSAPGLFFDFSERVKKETADTCEQCGKRTARFSESGVDISLCVEMIKHSGMHEHEYLALISSDRDFVPMLTFLKDRGERVIHVSTSGNQREMRSVSWSQVDLKDTYASLCKLESDKYLILTEPRADAKLEQAKNVLSENGLDFNIIDITQEDQISDQDLKFVLSNLGVWFKRPEVQNRIFPPHLISESISNLRREIIDGNIKTDLPHVSFDGTMVARADDTWGWMVAGSGRQNHIWEKYRTGGVS